MIKAIRGTRDLLPPATGLWNWVEQVSRETFRAYTSNDVVGVEVGGATKNVYAIGAGICDGLGFGANTRIALITRGLAEMTRYLHHKVAAGTIHPI